MKTTIQSLFVFMLLTNFSILYSQQSINNVQVKIYLQGNSTLIAQCITDVNGEFTFQFPEGLVDPISGTFIFKLRSGVGKSYTQTSTSHFNKKTSRPFVYVLKWIPDSKAQTKGAFAISGKSSI